MYWDIVFFLFRECFLISASFFLLLQAELLAAKAANGEEAADGPEKKNDRAVSGPVSGPLVMAEKPSRSLALGAARK